MELHSNKKVFITGITGFTGVYLEKYLTDIGFDVYGTTFDTPKSKKHFKVNILSEISLNDVLSEIQPNFVIHLAAISFVESTNKKQIYDVNVFGTINLLDALKKLNEKPFKVIVVSSATVYGNIEGVLNESLCPQPVNHYGNSKLAMENMTKAYYKSLDIIVVRPFNYTGVGQENHFLIPKIVSYFKNNEGEIPLGNIDVFREFNDVNYTVRCYSELLTSKAKSVTINICSGNAINIKLIIEEMQKIAGYKIKVVINPKFVRQNEINVLKGDANRLIELVGDFREEYTLSNTLRKMFNRNSK